MKINPHSHVSSVFSPQRNQRRGVVLIIALIAMMIIIGLTTVLQSVAIADLSTIKRLTSQIRRDAARETLRQYARPLVDDAILRFDGSPVLRLDGTPSYHTVDGFELILRAQDVDGLVDIRKTRPQVVEQVLPTALTEYYNDLRALDDVNNDDIRRLGHRGVANPRMLFTLGARSGQINTLTMPEAYATPDARFQTPPRQPDDVILLIE